MRKYIIFISLAMIIVSCKPIVEKEYTRKCVLSVVYTNGDTDTINCQFNGTANHPVYLRLGDSEGTCIHMGSSYSYLNVVCGVRKFNIISDETIN